MHVLVIAEDAPLRRLTLHRAPALNVGKTLEVAVGVDLRRAGTVTAFVAVLLASGGRDFAGVLAMHVAFGFCVGHAIGVRMVGLARVGRGLVTLAVAPYEAIEVRRIARRDALGAAIVRALRVHRCGASARACRLELQGRAIRRAAPGHFDLARNPGSEVEVSARVDGAGIVGPGARRCKEEPQSNEERRRFSEGRKHEHLRVVNATPSTPRTSRFRRYFARGADAQCDRPIIAADQRRVANTVPHPQLRSSIPHSVVTVRCV
jgi:hypothetical protein